MKRILAFMLCMSLITASFARSVIDRIGERTEITMVPQHQTDFIFTGYSHAENLQICAPVSVTVAEVPGASETLFTFYHSAFLPGDLPDRLPDGIATEASYPLTGSLSYYNSKKLTPLLALKRSGDDFRDIYRQRTLKPPLIRYDINYDVSRHRC
jgi:hypothetical protein